MVVLKQLSLVPADPSAPTVGSLQLASGKKTTAPPAECGRAVVRHDVLPAETEVESRVVTIPAAIRRVIPVAVILPMVQPIVIAIVVQIIMQPPMLPPAHRVAVSVSVVEFSMIFSVVQIIVVPVVAKAAVVSAAMVFIGIGGTCNRQQHANCGERKYDPFHRSTPFAKAS